MDLTKILNQTQTQPHHPPSLIEQGKIFFSHLILQLEVDLQYIQEQDVSSHYFYFGKIRVLYGKLNEQQKKLTAKDKINNKPYLFIQLPNIPGFLIESEKNNEVYTMYRATKVNPVLNSATDEIIRPEIFVLKSGILEEFYVLDDCFVRTKTSDKTLSVKQMSEMLLLLSESVRGN